MTRTTTNSAHLFHTSIDHENTSSDPETKMQDPGLQPSTSQVQLVPAMYMPYIDSPKMDWTVNDGFYHRFLKWKLKCKNILDCELAMLPDSKKCKKVIAWSGDFSMDEYVSWCLPTEELNSDTIWSKCEEFHKPQTNEVRARFDLLTSFHQGNKSVDARHNGVQAQVCLQNIHQKLQTSCIMTSFAFS